MSFLDRDSLAEARALVLKRRDDPEGITCPCCDQLAKRYKRPLYESMARSLIQLVREWTRTGDWVHVVKVGGRLISGDFAKLRYWGLIVGKPKEEGENKRTSGFWKPTELALRFLRGEVRLPSHVFIYDSDLEGVATTETISIHEALGHPFSYAEIMVGAGTSEARPS